MSAFSLFVGIDYSGAQTPSSRLKGPQVYAARSGELPELLTTPAAVQALGRVNAHPCRATGRAPRLRSGSSAWRSRGSAR